MDAQRKVITVLGGFAVSDVPASAWARPSAQRLVKLLAVTPGHHLHREIILESLWPDLNPDAAGNALRKALYMARRALEPDGARGSQTYIRSQGASISLSSALTVDLDLFLAASDVALMGQDPAAPALALTYYTGELLPSDLYEPWTEDIRRDLLHRYQRILERAAESASRSGNHAQAVEFLTRLVALDPLNEAAQRLYIRALAATGARRDALRQFQVFRDTLFQTLGVAPEEESLQLYAALSRESSTQFPVLPPILRTHVATPLVGREVPLAQLRDALLESQLGSGRMVFVGGETGVGTTRLVAQIAQEAAASGALVLAGAAHAGSLPYEAIINALAAHIGTLSPSQWEELKTLYPAVAYLLPVGRTDLSRLSPDPELDQSRFFNRHPLCFWHRLLGGSMIRGTWRRSITLSVEPTVGSSLTFMMSQCKSSVGVRI